MSYAMNLPAEMKKKYIDRRAKDAVELGQALAAKNAEPFQRVGHQLKGNAVTFGYPELSDLGKEMEEAAIRGDFACLQAQLTALEVWLKGQPA